MADSLLTSLAAGVVRAQKQARIPERPSEMKALDGNWVMPGDIMGKSAIYKMAASPFLQGAFTEQQMMALQVPSEYEACVFIGFEVEGQIVIVCWMGCSETKFSIPHGCESITDNMIQFIIPYEGSPFRDKLKYNPDTNTWLFVFEVSQPDGTCKHFARYSVCRD